MSAISDGPLIDLEEQIVGLKATIGILGHLIQSPNEVTRTEWGNVEDQLSAYAERIDALWDQAWEWDKRRDEQHAEALAAAKAEKAAPGSREDLEAAEGLWSLMAAAVRVIVERCAETGRPVKLGPITPAKLEPAPEPEPAPERMRW